MLKFYGFRKDYITHVFYVWNDTVRRLPLFLDERNHSPTGFEWGYGGSGPAQLAYAVLRQWGLIVGFSKILAKCRYQEFKWEVVAKFDEDYWELTAQDIFEALDIPPQ